MRKQEVEELIFSLVLPIIEGTNLELVDVEYVREKDWYLRIFIDKPGGIEIDDCQFVSEKITKIFDEKDPIKERYFLEVSSPGIDRPLKRDVDFIKAYGKKVDILFFAPWNGFKTIVAELEKHDENIVEILIKNEKQVIERKLIANIRPHIEF